ncbi:ABC transporter ATP-binding protein [Clostridium hydrogeniformans]|uniref:ABC transporter ATP-binding protein n=1 Tax=Clostridium hydrogeniformans TaxID=349933 RepID=UPI000487274A|nr:ABC transporter ATP-binding protein [Clostridium hydrogeniformans]
MKEIIGVKDLSCILSEKNILNNINLNFEEKKLYTIVGPNGSGKTTLLKHICKILDVNQGDIYIEGKSIGRFSGRDLSKNLSSVPQNTHTNFSYNVFDIVLMGRNPHIGRFQKESKADIEIAEKAMKITGTYDLRNEDIDVLSGGERQRVIIARALTQETPIMLLDEPISQLDIHHQIQIMNILKELVEKFNKTVICVLHDLNIAAQYSDEIILLDKGKVFRKGHPSQVITKEILREVYGMEFHIMENPINSSPLILPYNNI